MKIDENLYNP